MNSDVNCYGYSGMKLLDLYSHSMVLSTPILRTDFLLMIPLSCHLAVKCNSDPVLLKTLALLGAHFDCASKVPF